MFLKGDVEEEHVCTGQAKHRTHVLPITGDREIPLVLLVGLDLYPEDFEELGDLIDDLEVPSFRDL
jgi:hypothetical protein